jgi:hypothetical protein
MISLPFKKNSPSAPKINENHLSTTPSTIKKSPHNNYYKKAFLRNT